MSKIKIILLLILCIICTPRGNAQVVANFTANVNTGCPPLVVSFTNTSTGANSYSWNFGNTNTSALTNASTSYLTPGVYTVTLTASNGTSSDTRTMQIVVHTPPVVSFSTSDTLICPGAQVSFANNTNLLSAGAGSYYWDFGDGNSATTQNPAHIYAQPGYYSVSLTATNSDSCSSSQTINGYVHVRNKPVAQFYLNSNTFCTLPAQAIFTNQAIGSGPLTYSWSFGDGMTSTMSSPSHSYATIGIYTVKQKVTDIYGCTDSTSIPENIATSQLSPSFQLPDSVCVNSSVTFMNTTTSSFTGNTWIYGDGQIYTGLNPTHVYSTAGTYTVQLVITDGTCYDTVRHNISVKQAPAVTITNPSQICPPPVTVPFTTTAPAGTSYKWYFGDGDSSTLANPTHLYASDDFFFVKLVATNFCVNTVYDTVKIFSFLAGYNTGPFISGCAPLSVNFSLAAYTATPHLQAPAPYPYPITTIKYNFGDGSPPVTAATASHTYTTLGVFTSYVSVTFGNGCVDTVNTQIAVGQAPVIDSYWVVPKHVCRRDSITFHGKGSGLSPLSYNYYVLDTPTLSIGGIFDTTVGYTYHNAGLFHTYFTLSNNGCPSAHSPTIDILIDTPVARFYINPLSYPPSSFHCDSPLKVSLIESSIGATSRVWLFGDGATSTLANTSHIYAPGTYTPRLAVYNSTTGCRDTSSAGPLIVFNFKPVIQTPDTAVCKNSSIILTGAYITTGPPARAYFWYVNNIPIDTPKQITYVVNNTGYNSVMLIEKDDHGCNDTTYQNIFASQPAAGFFATPVNACVPSTVLFTDTSKDNTGAYVTSRAWTFGDGGSNTVSSTITGHLYGTIGGFSIKEIVTDNNGCKDSVYKSFYIHTHKPTANFVVANTNHCPGDTITFVNINTTGLVAAYWTFGDGATDNSISPVHSYAAAGTYTVMLVVTDTTGCVDTLVRTAYIKIAKPHAAFSENDSTGVCAPLVVNFTNTSTGTGLNYSWSFGNSNTSVANNPSNSYSVPGNYTVQLIVTDNHGCKDTAYHHVSLYGYSGTFSYTPLSGCPQLIVNFTANITNIPSITWDFADGTVTTPSAATTTSHTYTSPGKYVPKVILGDNVGCHTSITGTDTIRIDKVKAGFKETSSFCVYDTVHFTDTSRGLFAPVNGWQWYFGDGSYSITHNPAHNYHTPGTVSVMLVAADMAGCKDTVVQSIAIRALPTITASGDTTICPGDSALIAASGAISYLWAPAATIHCPACNPTFVAPIQPTTYTVTGTDAFGCKNKDSVKIAFKYKTVSYPGAGGQICLGQSITLSDSGAQVYSWYPTTGLSDPHSTHPIANPKGSITYLAIGKTASCIPDTGIVQVFVNPLPMVTAVAGSNLVIAGGKVNLQAAGANIVSFLWNHADLLNCDTCTDPIATMQQTTIFTVTATNQFGCQDSTHVLVNVLCDKSQVFIPNTFTPNGDGQNDVFFPRGIGIRIVKSFRIYNRWGELVFERSDFNLNDESKGWDGTYKGGKPIPDTYVYALDATCDEGQPISWKGDVTLLK